MSIVMTLYPVLTFAQSVPAGVTNIIPDGRTATTVTTNGNTSTVTTNTISGPDAFNSYSRFEIGAGNVGIRLGAGNRGVVAFEGARLMHVERLALRQAFDDVKNDDIAEALQRGEMGKRAADVTATDEGDPRSYHSEA